MKQRLDFEETLGEHDVGLILSSDGYLKGIWVPKEFEDKAIPKEVALIIKSSFGIDPNDPSVYRKIH